jgi:hypothetical protein
MLLILHLRSQICSERHKIYFLTNLTSMTRHSTRRSPTNRGLCNEGGTGMVLFRRVRRMGVLSELESEVVFESDTTIIAPLQLQQLTEHLSVGSIRNSERTKVALKDFAEVVAWANSYLNREIKTLREEFASPTKRFKFLLLRSPDRCELNALFRLSTEGVRGWTQYRISWRRISAETFACTE